MEMLDILKGIEIPYEFGIYSDSEDLSPNASRYEEKIYREAKLNNISIYTAWGCSQFVIISDKNVYKIPFDGQYYDEWDDEYTDEHYDATFEDYDVDHCKRTLEVYENAIIEDVEAIFAKIEVAGYSFNHQPIYKQEYAVTYLDEVKEASEESTTKANEMCNGKYIQLENNWLALAIDYYGLDFVQRLLQFIEDYDIQDLHRNNYGFRADGSPVLFDYCGYFGG